jgi:hypothetical protein
MPVLVYTVNPPAILSDHQIKILSPILSDSRSTQPIDALIQEKSEKKEKKKPRAFMPRC